MLLHSMMSNDGPQRPQVAATGSRSSKNQLAHAQLIAPQQKVKPSRKSGNSQPQHKKQHSLIAGQTQSVLTQE